MQEQELPLVRWTSGSLSLLVQRKEPKKHAPEHCALWASCPKGPRQRPGSANRTSECGQRNRRDPSRRPLRGFSGRCRRNAMGLREEQSARRARRSQSGRTSQAVALALALAVDLGVHVCRGEGGPETPVRVARRKRASSLHAQGCAFNEPRLDLADSERAASGVCSLWLLSLAQARESNPRVGRARKTAGCANKRIKGKNWIPAYAGMASKRKGAGFRLAPE